MCILCMHYTSTTKPHILCLTVDVTSLVTWELWHPITTDLAECTSEEWGTSRPALSLLSALPPPLAHSKGTQTQWLASLLGRKVSQGGFKISRQGRAPAKLEDGWARLLQRAMRHLVVSASTLGHFVLGWLKVLCHA